MPCGGTPLDLSLTRGNTVNLSRVNQKLNLFKMIDRSQIQVSMPWAKVTYSGKVKRISNPSQELACFVAQVRAHFKELAHVEYAYELAGEQAAKKKKTEEEESKLEAESDKKGKFVLRWYSHSPTDASILD